MDPASPQPRVLVCDDELGPRASIEFILRKDCRVVLTEAPEAALKEARGGSFDCAIIDWSMGDPISAPLDARCSGEILLRDLLAIDPTLSIIVLSAHGPAIGRQATAAGAFAYLSKPSSPQALSQTVRSAIEETRRKRPQE